MRRTIAAASAAAAATLIWMALAPPAGAATPAPAATAALRYLYGQQAADGSISGSAGPTEDTIIGAADNGYDPATLVRPGGASAFTFLAAKVAAGKVTTAGATAKLILAWVAAGKPAAIDGAALLGRLDGSSATGGFLLANGSFHAADPAVETANSFTQSLAVLADVAAGHALPAHAAGWLLCAQRGDGGFGYAITDSAATPPASCGDVSSDTNDSALAVEALDAAGAHGADAGATAYLHGAQQADGGFGFTGVGPSDPDSDAVVVQALVALGQDPSASAWTKGGRTPLGNLAGFETPPGSGAYLFPGNPAPDAFTTSEVPAALALKPLGARAEFVAGRSPGSATSMPPPSSSATPSSTPVVGVGLPISTVVPATPTAGVAGLATGASTVGSPDTAAGRAASSLSIAALVLTLTAGAGIAGRLRRTRRRR